MEEKRMNFFTSQNLSERDRAALQRAKRLVGRLNTSGDISRNQLIQELFGMSWDELRKELEAEIAKQGENQK